MKGDAYVYPSVDGYTVIFTHNGEPYDYAEGIDDELGAIEVARRGVYGKGTINIFEQTHWEKQWGTAWEGRRSGQQPRLQGQSLHTCGFVVAM